MMRKLLTTLASGVLCWMPISMIPQKRAEELKILCTADQPIRTNLLPSEDAGSIGCRSLPERARAEVKSSREDIQRLGGSQTL